MGLFSSIGKSLSKSFGSFAKGFKSNPIGSILGATGLPQSTSQMIPGGEFLQSGFQNIGEGMQDFWDSYTGRDIAMKNYELQKKQFDYQQRLNKEQQTREDNAMQRKVADLKAAGLNPVLAANGTGAASAPLKAAPAPQIENTSGAMRETLNNAFQGIIQVMSMKKDFAQKDAQIKLLQAEKAKADAEAAGINIENKYKDDIYAGKVKAQDLANQFAEGTFDNRVRLVAQDVKIKDQNIILNEIDKHWKELDITSKELDNAYAKLRNDYFRDEKELELTAKALAILSNWSDYQAKEFARKWYNEDFKVPVGFNPSNSYLAAIFAGVNGDKVLNFFDSIIPDSDSSNSFRYTRSERRAAYREATRYPEGSNFLWTQRMNKESDYGVRRNH